MCIQIAWTLQNCLYAINNLLEFVQHNLQFAMVWHWLSLVAPIYKNFSDKTYCIYTLVIFIYFNVFPCGNIQTMILYLSMKLFKWMFNSFFGWEFSCKIDAMLEEQGNKNHDGSIFLSYTMQHLHEDNR